MLGVDISHHQGSLTISSLKKAGVRFVIIKATQRNDYVDPEFYRFFREAKAANMLIGVYHFLETETLGGSGESQARKFVQTVRQASGGSIRNLIWCLDDERYKRYWDGQISDPTWQDAKAFIRGFHKITDGHPIFVYANGWRFERYKLDEVNGKAVKFWLAHWVTPNSVVADGNRTKHKVPNSQWMKRVNGKRVIIRQFTSGLRSPHWGNRRIDGNWTPKSAVELLSIANAKDTDWKDNDAEGKSQKDVVTDPYLEPWFKDVPAIASGANSGGLTVPAVLLIVALMVGFGVLMFAQMGASVNPVTRMV